MAKVKVLIKRNTKGGPGSGNWGHTGRPGSVGGSGASKGNGGRSDSNTGASAPKQFTRKLSPADRKTVDILKEAGVDLIGGNHYDNHDAAAAGVGAWSKGIIKSFKRGAIIDDYTPSGSKRSARISAISDETYTVQIDGKYYVKRYMPEDLHVRR